jgi:hypothetical protein
MDRELAVLLGLIFGSSGIIGFLIRSYIRRCDKEVESLREDRATAESELREDRDYYREAFFAVVGLAKRQGTVTEAIVEVAKEKTP